MHCALKPTHLTASEGPPSLPCMYHDALEVASIDAVRSGQQSSSEQTSVSRNIRFVLHALKSPALSEVPRTAQWRCVFMLHCRCVRQSQFWIWMWMCGPAPRAVQCGATRSSKWAARLSSHSWWTKTQASAYWHRALLRCGLQSNNLAAKQWLQVPQSGVSVVQQCSS